MKIRDSKSMYRPAAISLLSVSLLVLSPSCFNDDFNEAMKLELLPYEVMIPVNNVPVPGNGGLITNGVVTDTSVQLFWTRASDVETAQADLEYSLYQSESNNISTPDEAEANGTMVEDWQADMTYVEVNLLSPGITYYFNVVVRDGDGGRAAYVTAAVTTQTDAIYLSSVGPYTGDLADPKAASVREEIDSLCSAAAKMARTKALPCLNKRAFISIDPGDDIAGMPANFGIPRNRRIIGPTDIQIADNWADLLDGDIDVTLFDAGIVPDQWWSGSTSGGVYDISVDNCTGWTSTSRKGQAGNHEKTDDAWIQGNTPDCDAARYVLCVCW